jgi:hypothetical protein
MRPTGEQALFFGRENQNIELDTVLFVRRRIISAVMRVEFVSDGLSYWSLVISFF